jgi:type VI secretion system protein ImpL
LLGFLGAQLWQICRIKKFATQGERQPWRAKAQRAGIESRNRAFLRKRYTLLAPQSPPVAGHRRRSRHRTAGSGLRQQQWLEGNRTVLIYGGSLASEPDREKYTALRKLRRGRPLDGIVRVMPRRLT